MIIRLVFSLAALAAGCFPTPTTLFGEVLHLRGGTLIDGTGAEPQQADLWVRGGRILAIGEWDGGGEVRVLDVSGLVITPGFIDTHAHGNPTSTPAFPNFIHMGVTTLCLGQDGSSLHADDLETWRRNVEQTGAAPNIAPFVGHGTLRTRSGVGLDPEPGADSIGNMVRMLETAMAAGAFGMTTGLEYQPGSFAGPGELAALARVVAARGGLVMSHLRSEDDDAIEAALDEFFEQGRASGVNLHVSHLKIVYGHGRERAEEILRILENARREGLTVTADVYPYTASFTGIGIVFPDWAKPPHDYAEVVRERRDELAAFLRERVNLRNGPQATLFGTGRWRGKTLAQAADEAGVPFEEILIGMGPSGASAAYFVMDEEVMETFLAAPGVMVSSDGSPTMRHPRGHGAFARVLARHVREQGRLSLPEAIHKMTGLPAATLGLDQNRGNSEDPRHWRRGLLRPGWAADLAVFDPAAVRDRATFEEPHQLAEGFVHVLVNGDFVLRDGQPQSTSPGKVLRLNRAEN